MIMSLDRRTLYLACRGMMCYVKRTLISQGSTEQYANEKAFECALEYMRDNVWFEE